MIPASFCVRFVRYVMHIILAGLILTTLLFAKSSNAWTYIFPCSLKGQKLKSMSFFKSGCVWYQDYRCHHNAITSLLWDVYCKTAEISNGAWLQWLWDAANTRYLLQSSMSVYYRFNFWMEEGVTFETLITYKGNVGDVWSVWLGRLPATSLGVKEQRRIFYNKLV